MNHFCFFYIIFVTIILMVYLTKVENIMEMKTIRLNNGLEIRRR